MSISRAIPSRLPILATLLGLALAGCDGVPALEVSTRNAGGQEAVAANDSTALPLPDPVLGPVDRRKAALATFLEERQVGEVPAHRDASVDLDGDGFLAARVRCRHLQCRDAIAAGQGESQQGCEDRKATRDGATDGHAGIHEVGTRPD